MTIDRTRPEVSRYGKVIDQGRCIGCHACTTACRSENDVPLGVTRTYVKSVDVGAYPDVARVFQVTRCNQCADAPCVAACPTRAIHRRPDGIVDIDHRSCIGCKACIAACPYDAIFINPATHTAEKCNLCAHRLEIGLEPACVTVCPVGAIIVGDLDDPTSRVAQVVAAGETSVRRPDKGTEPSLFYLGGHEAALDPLAAHRPDGGLFMWSEQGKVPHQVPSGTAEPRDAVLSYDVPHRAPWDWRVTLYTVTKAVAAGVYLAALLLVATGSLDRSSALFGARLALVAIAALVATGVALVADLERPERFWMLLARPHWKSWLVRGAVILLAYGGVLVAHLVLAATGALRPALLLGVVGAPVAALAAAYTAFLLHASHGRDLWKSPLLAPHLVVQAFVAGAAGLLLLAETVDVAPTAAIARLLIVALIGHVAFDLAEVLGAHRTAHAAAAAALLVDGRHARLHWAGVLLASLAAAVAVPAPVAAAALALLGLSLSEHAYLQAGQGVPLA